MYCNKQHDITIKPHTFLWSISRCTIIFINTVDQKFGLVLSEKSKILMTVLKAFNLLLYIFIYYLGFLKIVGSSSQRCHMKCSVYEIQCKWLCFSVIKWIMTNHLVGSWKHTPKIIETYMSVTLNKDQIALDGQTYVDYTVDGCG